MFLINKNITALLCQTKEKQAKEKFVAFAHDLSYFCEKGGFSVTQAFLWVFLLSVLSSKDDTNLATNTNILLLLLLGLSNNAVDNTNSFGCNRLFGNLTTFQ